MTNTKAIAFRRKIVVDVNRKVKDQIGRVQRGQWIWINGMNARILNMVGALVIVVRYDRRTRTREILQYA